jgi:hypothetical protein
MLLPQAGREARLSRPGPNFQTASNTGRNVRIFSNELALLAIALFISLAAFASDAEAACSGEVVRDFVGITIDVLEEVDVEAAERKELTSVISNGQRMDVPFGRMNSEWEKLKQLYEHGDCLFYFRTDQDSWNGLYGREGYVLVREGTVIYVIITQLS